MTFYTVNVRRGPLSGSASDNVRLNVVAGVYDVQHVKDSLVFKGADQRNGGDITLDLADYVEIGNFPDVAPNTQVEIVRSPEYVRVYDGQTNEILPELTTPLNNCLHAMLKASEFGADRRQLTWLIINEHADALESITMANGHTIGTQFNCLDTEKSSSFDLLLETAKTQFS